MHFARTYSAQTLFLDGRIIAVEVDLSHGLHSFAIVGLPDKAVEESRDRVSAAIKNSGYESPKSTNHKVIVSLAPADVKKEGPLFDLAIALAYLLANQDIAFDPANKLFLGELALDGSLRSVKGTLPLVLAAKKDGFKEVYVPRQNASEAALVEGIAVYPVDTLSGLISILDTKRPENIAQPQPHPRTNPSHYKTEQTYTDFNEVKGNESAKRALEIAAAGGHNIALTGPAGTGKTMLARALPGILPDLSFEEMLEVTAIHSVAGLLTNTILTTPPFRAPHHSASYTAIVGGGSIPRPGEVTLAHRGVLFMDEFPEFDKRVIEVLRQPLEDRYVTISRVRGSGIFPAGCLLVVALNPCPCGNFGTRESCTCSAYDLARYDRKLSGPIIDRIDMWVDVPKLSIQEIETKTQGESSEIIQKRVREARDHALKETGKPNAYLKAQEIEHSHRLAEDARVILRGAAENLHLSMRSYHKVIKLAHTIADLAHEETIAKHHILEALQYRPRTGS